MLIGRFDTRHILYSCFEDNIIGSYTVLQPPQSFCLLMKTPFVEGLRLEVKIPQP